MASRYNSVGTAHLITEEEPLAKSADDVPTRMWYKINWVPILQLAKSNQRMTKLKCKICDKKINSFYKQMLTCKCDHIFCTKHLYFGAGCSIMGSWLKINSFVKNNCKKRHSEWHEKF